MAIQKYAGDRVTGLSSDTKPTNIADGAVFFETDTRKIYLKKAGVWAEVDYDNYTDAEAVSAIKADEDWNATDWDTAYGWGNHSAAGYLTDAASDGKTYGRKDGDWAEVTGGGAIEVVFDGGSGAIQASTQLWLIVPKAITITGAYAFSDVSTTTVVDVWKDTIANYPPTNDDSITASAPITITTATNSSDTTLTGWTTAIAALSVLVFNIDSNTASKRLTVVLTYNRA